MKTYSELLRFCRKKGNFTQKELVEQLSHFSDNFIDLNPGTLSRWETGVTFPSLKKRKALLHYIYQQGFLEDLECMDYIKMSFQNLTHPISLKLDHNYDGLIGNFPPFKVDSKLYNFTNISQCPDNKLIYITDIERARHSSNYYSLNFSKLKEWCNFESSFCLGCELDGEHLGHILMFKVSSEIAIEVIHNQKSIFSITQDDLLSMDEKGTYIIHSFFGVNSEIMAMLSIQTYLFMLENRNSIENISTFITNRDYLKLMRLYGNRVIKKDFDIDGNYHWYGTLTPVEEILFSDMITQMLLQ